jgi:hypothetical protein
MTIPDHREHLGDGQEVSHHGVEGPCFGAIGTDVGVEEVQNVSACGVCRRGSRDAVRDRGTVTRVFWFWIMVCLI